MRDFKSHNLRFLLICLAAAGGLMEGLEGCASMALYRLIAIFAVPGLLYLEGLRGELEPVREGKLAALYAASQLVFMGLTRLALQNPGALSLLRPLEASWYVLAMVLYPCLIPALKRLDAQGRGAAVVVSLALSLAVGYLRALDGFLALSRLLALLPYYLLGWFVGHPLGEENPAFHRSGLPVFAGLALIGSVAVLMVPDFDGPTLARSVGYAVSGSMLHRAVLTLGALGWIGTLRRLSPDKYIPLVTESGSAVLSVYLAQGVLSLFLRAQMGILERVPLAVAAMVLTAVTLALFLGGPSTNKAAEAWRELRHEEMGK